MISAHIFCTSTTSRYAPVWECLNSLSAFCDKMTVYDLGMSETTGRMIRVFSDTKRKIRVETSVPEMKDLADDEWIYFSMIDEVVHEDSYHYLWDFAALHYGEFTAVDVPVHEALAEVSEDDIVQTRLVRKNILDQFKFNGSGTTTQLPGSFRSPSGIMPAPVWKFSFRLPESGCMPYGRTKGFFDSHSGPPKSIARLIGRTSYSLPFVK